MSTEYTVREATQADAAYVAEHMNAADIAELWAASHTKPYAALNRALVQRDTKVGLADGQSICMFGCVPPGFLSNVATPWLLGTVELPKHGRGFLRRSRVYFEGFKRDYEVLVNYVDARHEHAIRWLAWLGFVLEPARPFGVERLPFHRFSVMRDV